MIKQVDTDLPYIYMLVGLPGSGKSEYASKLAEKRNAVVISSDTLRQELYGDINTQDKNEDLFNELHKRVKLELNNNHRNVIYDATNINWKKRRAFLKSIKNIKCNKVCIVIATMLSTCIENNKKRERTIPTDVITRMYCNYYVPAYFEGWDQISIEYPFMEQNINGSFITPSVQFENYDQHNSHHDLSLGNHLVNTALALKNEKDELKAAGLLHDIGKPYTASFVNSKGETTEDCHYYQHHCVGAYESLFYRYNTENINSKLKIAALINYHMFPYFFKSNQNSQKVFEKYRKIWGDDFYKDIMKLHDADRKAH